MDLKTAYDLANRVKNESPEFSDDVAPIIEALEGVEAIYNLPEEAYDPSDDEDVVSFLETAYKTSQRIQHSNKRNATVNIQLNQVSIYVMDFAEAVGVDFSDYPDDPEDENGNLDWKQVHANSLEFEWKLEVWA